MPFSMPWKIPLHHHLVHSVLFYMLQPARVFFFHKVLCLDIIRKDARNDGDFFQVISNLPTIPAMTHRNQFVAEQVLPLLHEHRLLIHY